MVDGAQPPSPKVPLAPWRDVAAGGTAGVIGALVGQPLDTVRVRMQGAMGSQFSGTLDCLRKTVEWDGVRGLFKGSIPQVAGMCFNNGLMFGVVGLTLRALEEHRRGSTATPSNTVTMRAEAAYQSIFIAGSIAATCQGLVIIPTDRLKCQLQAYTKGKGGGGGNPPTVLETINRVKAAQGFGGIFRGACGAGPCPEYAVAPPIMASLHRRDGNTSVLPLCILGKSA